MTAFFASDLHLDRAAGPVFERFAGFLEHVPAAGDSLYLLGDLFDAWIGDDNASTADNAAILACLAACTTRGVAGYWIAGNRDFLTGSRFLEAAHLTALSEPWVFELFGERTVICHGDHLCTDDAAYQAFRAEARGAAWRDAFLAQPLDRRRTLVAGMRERSEQEKAAKSAAIMDVNADAVVRLLESSDAVRLIHGHTHRPGWHEHAIGDRSARRWVLPAWEDAPGYLAVDAAGTRLVSLN